MKGTHKGKTISVFFDEKKFSNSVHGSLICISCHFDLEGKEFPHDEDLQPVNCGNCHASEYNEHEKSLHGKALLKGDQLAPHCYDCHGKHDILSAKDPNSPTTPLKIPFLCGKCHAEIEILHRKVIKGELENYLVEPYPQIVIRAIRIFGWIALTIGFSIIIWIVYAMIFAYR